MEITHSDRLGFGKIMILNVTNAFLVWLACTLSFILGLPSLGSTGKFGSYIFWS
jgi:hypothetical protein